MSKIGRRPINIGNANIEIKNNEVHYKGKKASGVHVVPSLLSVELKGKDLFITPKEITSDTNRLWGLHRALIANKVKGSDVGFEKQLRINGLGFKAVATGNKLQFSLGFSHKIDYELPEAVTIIIDKSGQLLTFASADKELLGQVCSDIRALRPPEPYKGTGIQYVNEVILRKAGKAKSS
jgi:large subunit ribosomal protein L6